MQYLHSDTARKVTSETELALTLESINVVDSLVQLAEPQKSKYL